MYGPYGGIHKNFHIRIIIRNGDRTLWNTISNYVESIFANLPKTPEMLARKQAMLTKDAGQVPTVESRRQKRARGYQHCHRRLTAILMTTQFRTYPLHLQKFPIMKSTLLPNKSMNILIIRHHFASGDGNRCFPVHHGPSQPVPRPVPYRLSKCSWRPYE